MNIEHRTIYGRDHTSSKMKADYLPHDNLRTKTYLQMLIMVALPSMFVIIPISLIDVTEARNFLLLIFGVPIIAVASVALVLIPKYIDTISYELREDDIVMNIGLITRTKKVVPYRTITNMSVAQGPFDRLLGLTTIKIQTAGSSAPHAGPEEMLIGLDNVTAINIRRHIDFRLHSLRGGTAGISHDLESDLSLLIEIRDYLKIISDSYPK